MKRLLMVALALVAPVAARAQREPAAATTALADEVRQTLRQYDLALSRGDAEALGRHWADEYTFVNPAGERLTKADRLGNIRTSRTTFDTLAPRLSDERVRVYGTVAVYSTTTTITGDYSGRAHRGDYRALVVLVKREGRWQQVASQLTRVEGS